MKKRIIAAMAFFGITVFNTVMAQETVKNENPVKKLVSTKGTINSSHKKALKVNYKGVEYYIIDGIWHTKFKNKLILKQPPKGARLTFVPEGGEMVTMGGKKYYKSNGIFYKKIKGGFYEVARP
ncbi:MAG TPA: hypothetical protein ENK46_01440 [Flavobacteriia bacterium]|nr:hypothetical protein [Flavobacteriia bacterium]